MLIYSGTENFVSVICASIPVLRPLWSRILRREASSSGGSRPFRSYEMDRISKDPENALGSSYTGGRGILETKVFTSNSHDNAVPDNASDETILRDTWEHNHKTGNVVRKTEISVSYSGDGPNTRRM
jgi:hypothetical protein